MLKHKVYFYDFCLEKYQKINYNETAFKLVWFNDLQIPEITIQIVHTNHAK